MKSVSTSAKRQRDKHPDEWVPRRQIEPTRELPPPLEPPLLEKWSLEHETETTAATVEQLREPKWRREHPERPQARDNRSSSSSSSESLTDTEMELVDVCTILSENSEAEGSLRGGPITLDLTKCDSNKADCRNNCRKLVENSKPLLLIRSPIDSGRGDKEQTRRFPWHSSVTCTKYKCTEVGISFTHIHIPQTV